MVHFIYEQLRAQRGSEKHSSAEFPVKDRYKGNDMCNRMQFCITGPSVLLNFPFIFW